MLKRRQEDGFNLSFLDVMACGLGAVLMILILVKFQSNTPIPTDEVERLQSELAAQQTEGEKIASRVANDAKVLAALIAANKDTERQIMALTATQQQTTAAIADKRAIVAKLEQSIAAAGPLQTNDPLEITGSGEEKYLIGLQMQGRRIGLLLDASASMTDEGLIDIIRRKIGSDAQKKQGPKWRRTVNVAKWMLARLPDDASVTVVAFNSDATVLGDQAVNSAADEQSIRALAGAIDNIVPQNGTNLLKGLDTINQAMAAMTDLYVITDGLPTLVAKGTGFNERRGCRPVSGREATITGECRMQVFLHAFQTAAPRIPTNIVLLPLEGEPQAPAAYWDWADITGGTFISPASSWP